MRQAMDGILPSAIRWRGGKANLSPNFMARMFRATRGRLDHPEGGDGKFLGRFVADAALESTRERFLAHPTESDALAVWQAFTLGVWLNHVQLAAEGSESVPKEGVRPWTPI